MSRRVARLHRPAIGRRVGKALVGLGILGHPATATDLDRVVFGSLDATASGFLSVGAKIAEKGTGPAMLVSAGLGRDGQEGRNAAAVFGHQWYLDEGVVGAFAGPEVSFATPAGDEGASFRAVRTGLRLQGEAWLRPSRETLVQSTLVAGTARRSLWVRLAAGCRIREGYVGPEFTASTDGTGYRTWSLGVHATDFTLANIHVRLSAGGQVLMRERRFGPYVGLAVWRDW